MNMSNAVLRQLLGIDLCRSARDACELAFETAGETPPREMAALLVRLSRKETEAFKYVSGGRAQLEADEKAYGRYQARLADLRGALSAKYGPKLDARNYLTVVLVWLEDTRETMPKHPPDRWLCWREMAETVAKLRDCYPDDEDHVDAGQVVGEAVYREVAPMLVHGA